MASLEPPDLMLMARLNTVSMDPTRRLDRCQSQMLLTVARAWGQAAG